MSHCPTTHSARLSVSPPCFPLFCLAVDTRSYFVTQTIHSSADSLVWWHCRQAPPCPAFRGILSQQRKSGRLILALDEILPVSETVELLMSLWYYSDSRLETEIQNNKTTTTKIPTWLVFFGINPWRNYKLFSRQKFKMEKPKRNLIYSFYNCTCDQTVGFWCELVPFLRVLSKCQTKVV